MQNFENQPSDTANLQLINQFYTAFSQSDAAAMGACYHPQAEFEDPAFGKLDANELKAMWAMLLSRAKGQIKISFSNPQANAQHGAADWEAHYLFSQTNRQVHNIVKARFEFKDGLIYRHKDSFDLWRWSRQALGISGYLLGWSGFFKNTMQQRAVVTLEKYMLKNNLK